jgi:type II secretory pathway pseudopilin PulG
MELTIVLAILAIIAAILVPVFLAATDRARLRADVQSARVIASAITQYNLERGSPPSGYPANMANILTRLTQVDMLQAGAALPQTAGAQWIVYGGTVRLDLRPPLAVAAATRSRAAALSDEERALILPLVP